MFFYAIHLIEFQLVNYIFNFFLIFFILKKYKLENIKINNKGSLIIKTSLSSIIT